MTKAWRDGFSAAARGARTCAIQHGKTGTVIEMITSVMLVEGGYLHTMKLLIERATDTVDPEAEQRRRKGILSRSLRRLGDFLFGW